MTSEELLLLADEFKNISDRYSESYMQQTDHVVQHMFFGKHLGWWEASYTLRRRAEKLAEEERNSE